MCWEMEIGVDLSIAEPLWREAAVGRQQLKGTIWGLDQGCHGSMASVDSGCVRYSAAYHEAFRISYDSTQVGYTTQSIDRTIDALLDDM